MRVQPDIRTRQVNPFAQTCQRGSENVMAGRGSKDATSRHCQPPAQPP